MKFQKSIVIMLATIAAGAAVVGCVLRGGESTAAEYAELYQQSLGEFEGDAAHIDTGVARFAHAFADLTASDIEQRMRALYAERLFFNDTIHTFHDREDLLAYLVQTGEALNHSRIAIEQVISDGADVFVRWTMDFQTTAAGRKIHSRSIGVTHLRFNADGQVILHQDFWDSGHALYAHLPVVGIAVRSARRRMQNPPTDD